MKKILLIEDNHQVSFAINSALKASGYEITTAFDAISAMTKARECPPDVVLLDINLPGGNGFLVAERMRNFDETSGLPIIFITASKQAGLKEKAASLGAVEFLEKPFGAKELIYAIEMALSSEKVFDDVKLG